MKKEKGNAQVIYSTHTAEDETFRLFLKLALQKAEYF